MPYQRILQRINRRSGQMRILSDQELKTHSRNLKKQIADNDKKIDEENLVDIFSTIREAANRVLHMYATDEQVLGGLSLYHGHIAEMKTGEGKSLAACLPLYAKSMIYDQVFLVTTNDYLASRDCQNIGRVFTWLGLTVSDASKDLFDEFGEQKEFDVEERKVAYSANIIYISNATLAFDYLIDALAENTQQRFIAPLNYAILDEIDAILLDSAQMPLIISGAPKVQSNYFEIANDFVNSLKENEDFKRDEEQKKVWLTERGIERAKQFFSLPDLLSRQYFTLYQHLVIALKACYTLKKEKDYIIDAGEVKLLDYKNGRILEGSNLQSGLHQAIQAKEGVELTPESQTISSITYQNLFRKFRELAGMSGTVKVAEDEFIQTYHLPVDVIETHKQVIRRDHEPEKYVTFKAKLAASLKKIRELHEKGRPVLVITGSVDMSELYSMHLLNMGLSHNILSAKSAAKEAQIVREAGAYKAITVSTTMAGRGTDIKISQASIEAGGLAVILTERMLNQRIELQARGRTGRQGEPGDTYVYESLEDDVIKYYVQEAVQSYYDKHQNMTGRIRSSRIGKLFLRAQKIAEEKAADERLRALQFDEVLKLQKNRLDESRHFIMTVDNAKELEELIMEKTESVIERQLSALDLELVKEKMPRFILDYIDYDFRNPEIFEGMKDFTEIKSYIIDQLLLKNFQKKRDFLQNNEAAYLQFLKIAILKALDSSWSKQVDALNQLRFVTQSRATAQKNPILEFENEAQRAYKNRKSEIENLIVKNSALSLLEIKKGELIVTFP